MPDLDDKARRRRLLRLAALAGTLLGLVCSSLPPEYRTACSTVAQIAQLNSCGGSP